MSIRTSDALTRLFYYKIFTLTIKADSNLPLGLILTDKVDNQRF